MAQGDIIRELLATEYGPYITAAVVVIGFLQRFLGPKHDWVETRRRWLLLKLDEFLSMFGEYSVLNPDVSWYAYTVTVPERAVLPTEEPSDALERFLYQGNGTITYHRNLIAALKRLHLPTGATVESIGSWVYRESLLASKQHHATIFPHPTRERAFLLLHHKEYSWITHLVKHYRGVDAERGDPDNMLSSALDTAPVSLEVEPAPGQPPGESRTSPK